jgi:nucleoid-associated protein YgaU
MPLILIWALVGLFVAGGAGLYVAHEAGWLDREPQVAAAPPAPAPLIAQPQNAAPPQAAPAPSFDLVRVEPTGDAVMAGRAAPMATVEVLSNGAVISTTKADAGGDWAIVLQKPLAPGAHDLSLMAISADGVLRQPSTERATVVIPEGGKGEVIALISQPNQPSRVVQSPAVEPAAAPVAVAKVEPPAPAAPPPAAPAPAPSAEVVLPPLASDNTTLASVAPTVDAPAPPPAPTPPVVAAPVVAAPAPAVAIELPALASTGTDLATTAPTLETPAPQAPVITLPPLASEGTNLAAAPVVDPPAPPPAPAAPEPTGTVLVEAVELEGTRLYIAGAAASGAAIRAYVDDVELAETKANDGGRFLVEGDKTFTPGTYRIRIDRLRADGTVVARAEVPFEVIPVPPVAAAPAPVPAPVPVAAAPAPAVAPTPVAEAPAAPVAAPAPAVAAPAAPAPAAEAPAPVVAAAPAPAAEAPAAPAPAAAPAVIGVAPTIVAGADGRRVVIVKTGDNLWNIARAAYGEGFRYTTIYRANRKQIRDPDWIYPGQVFRVPDRAPRG